MKSTQYIHLRKNGANHFMKWPLLCGLLVLTLAQLTPAADAFYKNDVIINYPENVSQIPVIDATNFINDETFIINFTTISGSSPFYETSDTLNYTNIGTMVCNTGFQFDNKPSGTGARTVSSSFYNSGQISCGSTNNIGSSFISINGIFLYSLSYAQCLVDATNIANPGRIDVGLDGMIRLTGDNVNLDQGVLSLEGSGANLAGSGLKDLNTNAWNPNFNLGASNASSCFMSGLFYTLRLTNSTAYIKQDGLGTSNVTIRAVFVQDTSGPGITNYVYFPETGIDALGQDYAVVEWAGTYLNPSDDSTQNNYLYLLNSYSEGSDTNKIYYNGVPYNFLVEQSPTPLLIGVPAPAGFSDIFPSEAVTNWYAYANAQLVSSSVTTNDIPNRSITNLPGRIEISSKDNLSLNNALITGANYVKLDSPNQFAGSPQLVQAPFFDINLGVTNGFMTVSNLLAPTLPNWSGNIQAWSQRWKSVDASGVTNDFRVLIVGSQLNPLSQSQVQDLILHATNSLVLSDTLNIMRTFTTDAQNLTLTTNPPGYGATSLDGELNVGNAGVFWASALPNLRNLTNNGAIRFQNLAQFIGSSNIYSVDPGSTLAAASGILAGISPSKNVQAGNRVQIGTNFYSFATAITNSVRNQVKLASSFDASLTNLIAAINHLSGAGTVYSTNTVINLDVIASALTNHAFMVVAQTPGTNGNAIQTGLSVDATNLTWGGNLTLSGGVDYVPATTNLVSSTSFPYENIVNRGLISDNGSAMWADNFESSGVVSNGIGSFNLAAVTAVLTNSDVIAGNDIIITADSLVTSNTLLQAGRSLTLTVTNLLTDGGVTNGNVWVLGSTNGAGGNGLILPLKPATCDLLGTTITNNIPGPNQVNNNIWSGQDFGASVSGYVNNAAVGRLILDAFGSGSKYKFTGAGTNNALYVDYLEFRDYATNFDGQGNLSALNINTNIVIYYAQAMINGESVAQKINHANGDHLRWVPTYAGYFSSTNLVYPPGVTNTLNTGLVQSSQMDSDGDGIINAIDPTPVFVPAQMNFTAGIATNVAPLSVRVQWTTCANATNFIYYTTNLTSGSWLPYTNFNQFYYGNDLPVANASHANNFVSPQPYGSAATNVWFFDAITNTPHFYRVVVQPWLTYPY